MALVDPSILEMPQDPAAGVMPYYDHVLTWLRAELAGLTADQLDFDDRSPDKEWMWWSIRRQVSHIGWDALVFTHRRCRELLWPDGQDPAPVVWKHHHLGPEMKYDRMLDEDLYWEIPDLLAKIEIGISWLQRLVAEHSIDSLRATKVSVRGTHFWSYVIQVLPRGAAPDAQQPGFIQYDLEGSLWMVFYELTAHIRTIQRLKRAQQIRPVLELARFGYLRLPEYWGDTDTNGPPMRRLPTTM